MVAAEFLRLVMRRWYVVVLGAALSVGALWVGVHQPPVYFMQLDVVLLSPAETTGTNTLRDGPYQLTPLAGLVVTDVTGGIQQPMTATATTTLYGEGVREGERVRLRNRGSQWRPVYEVPVIDVQVVGPDGEAVRRRAQELVDGLGRALAERQAKEGVAETSRATPKSSPADPVLQQIGGSRARAAASIAVLGAASTFVFVVLIDRALARRNRRRATAVHAPSRGSILAGAGR